MTAARLRRSGQNVHYDLKAFTAVIFGFNPGYTCLQSKSLENTVGKGKIARNEQFFLFQQCFLSFFGELSAIFIKSKLVCKLFQFGRV